MHYDTEVNEETAPEIADAICSGGLYLAMMTPGAHSHYAYGGAGSLNLAEQKGAQELGARTVDLTYGALKKAWHKDEAYAPCFVLWNGSYGYDLATLAVRQMYQNLKNSVADLCKYEAQKGGKLYFGLEPKPNEGHPCMLIPTVASALVFWNKLKNEFGIDISKKGLNMETGHSEMIGLDPVYDLVEQVDNNAVMHIHLNSQGYNDGIVHGGPGKFDIDHGVRINGINIAMAGLLQQGNYSRWKGHDMQARGYDNEEQAIDRVVRSILSWEACEFAARQLDEKALTNCLATKQTAKAEDMIRGLVVTASQWFDEHNR